MTEEQILAKKQTVDGIIESDSFTRGLMTMQSGGLSLQKATEIHNAVVNASELATAQTIVEAWTASTIDALGLMYKPS